MNQHKTIRSKKFTTYHTPPSTLFSIGVFRDEACQNALRNSQKLSNRGGCSFTESQNKKSPDYNHKNKKSINNNTKNRQNHKNTPAFSKSQSQTFKILYHGHEHKKYLIAATLMHLSQNHEIKSHQITITNFKRCQITVTKYSWG